MKEKDIKNILEEVLMSQTFKKAQTTSNLLKFLVQATMDNVDVKEATIGIELLGKNYAGKNNDARIRVNIYNLRQKLEKYYTTEGKDNEWRIVIPKGRYQVEFEKKKTEYKIKEGTILKFSTGLNVILLFAVIIFTVQFFYKSTVPIWNSFFKNDKETILYLGDVYGVLGKTATGNYGWNRDYVINNKYDFYSLLNKNPELKGKIKESSYTYLTGMAAVSVKNIGELFYNNESDYAVQLASSYRVEDIKKKNAIYVGLMKNNNPFIRLFNQQNNNFRLHKSKLYYSNKKTNKDTIFNLPDSGMENELAIVSKINGPDGSSQLLFFSDHDMGVKGTIEYFTNKDSLAKFSNTYLKRKENFTALYRVIGQERTNFQMELVLVD